jgi:hypothetical protein
MYFAPKAGLAAGSFVLCGRLEGKRDIEGREREEKRVEA